VRRQSWFVRLAERGPTLVGFLTAREAQVLVLIGVLLAGLAAVREAERTEAA
jgi:hypothetical protein